jgi:hypothetical protein
MVVLLDPYALPEKGRVELKIERCFEIKVSAEEARRRVNRWLRDEVSMLISGDLPTLVVGERVIWRVSTWISFPHTGRAGMVGMVDVDITTGVINNLQECKTEIERQAEEVAARQPVYHPKKAPEQYLAGNIFPGPKLQILEDGTLTPLVPVSKKRP